MGDSNHLIICHGEFVDSTIEFQIVMGALELGVIPPHMTIDVALSQMSHDDRRKCKRKFRKIARKELAEWGKSNKMVMKWEAASPALRRRVVEIACKHYGKKMLEQPVENS